ncbi:MAG: HepT-like ribonuclease domain-containing protein [Acidobacteriaceae bacterium]
MPFRDTQSHLRDIDESIDLIDTFLLGMDFEAYRMDLKSQSAVERQLQIITEAAIRLGEEAETLCPGPDWKGIRGMGNFLRHEYQRIEDKIVWDTVMHDLPPLKAAVLRALTPPQTNPSWR